MKSGDVSYIGFASVCGRIAWLDRLKIAAAFAVVMTHIASIPWQVLSPSTVGWAVSSIYEVATRFCVPAFFFATGAVLLNPNKNVNSDDLCRYIFRASISALTASGFYVLFELMLDGWQGWRYFIYRVVDGPYFIWYLWALVGIYLLMPILRAIASDHKLLTYSCVVTFIFVIGKSSVISMVPGSLIDAAYGNIIIFNRGAEAIFYCLLGGWFVSHKLSRRAEKGIMAIGFCSLVAALLLNWKHAISVGPDLYYVARDNILITLFSAAVFVCFTRWGSIRPLGRFERAACQCGISIYLVHPFIRLAFERIPFFSGVLRLLMSHPAVMIPLVSFFCYILSLAVGFLWRSLHASVMSRRSR